MEFIERWKFERLGRIYLFSGRRYSGGDHAEDQIDEEVKEDRQADIMELQQEIVFDQAEDMIGKKYWL